MNTEMLLEDIRKIMVKYGYQCRDMADEIVQAALNSQAKSVPVGYVLETPSMYGARLINGLKHNTPLYATPQSIEADKVRELEAKILDLPRYSFLSPKEGGVRRCGDKSGAWIERYEVIKIIEAMKGV